MNTSELYKLIEDVYTDNISLEKAEVIIKCYELILKLVK